jgi:transcriptional regulator with XRE-family HTH domain
MSWEKVGHEVRARRTDLGLTQAEVADRGGPSVETLRMVENNRAGRLSPRMRRALERALQWESGSVDAVLEGGSATVARLQPQAATADRFAMARQVLSMKEAVTRHTLTMDPRSRAALNAEFKEAARDAEDAIIKVLGWLDDTERGEAIELLGQLRTEI